MSAISMFVIRFLVIALLSGWLFFSLVNQIFMLRATAKHTRYHFWKWDIFALIPYWGFWCAAPSGDSVLLYRDQQQNGALTTWKRAWSLKPVGLSFLWSPQIRKWKAADGWFPLLVSVAEGKKKTEDIYLSRLYIATAVHVSHLERANWSELRQFMVARISGIDRDEPAEILFVSPFFHLDDAL